MVFKQSTQPNVHTPTQVIQILTLKQRMKVDGAPPSSRLLSSPLQFVSLSLHEQVFYSVMLPPTQC